ncbi:MAG: hypothetical protein KQI35_05285 [Bacteroidetes bacterium]|nr:hypothetical protein [Bacteroidota bacterium]
MENHEREILWGYLTELRKELVESQKIRTQVIGFKITFVTALIAFIAAKLLSDYEKVAEFNNLYYYLLLIPAVASLFFDFLIYSYSFSIKRIGLYIKHVLEPKLKDSLKDFNQALWQEYLEQPFNSQKLANTGNLGLTAVAAVIALIPIVLFSTIIYFSIIIAFVILGLIGVDAYAMNSSGRLIKKADDHFENLKQNKKGNERNENAT